jgi:hypothetical protein
MFTVQNTIERKQERMQIDGHSLGSTATATLCAWCLSEQGIAAGEGSHGICVPHAEWLLTQWKKHGRRSRRLSA